MQLSMKIILLKMLKCQQHLAFSNELAGKIQHLTVWKHEKPIYLSILVFLSSWNFMLNWVEHEKDL